MGSMMADLGGIRATINNLRKKKGEEELSVDDMLVKLFNEVAYVWPRVGYPPLVTPFSQYTKNIALMNASYHRTGQGTVRDDGRLYVGNDSRKERKGARRSMSGTQRSCRTEAVLSLQMPIRTLCF